MERFNAGEGTQYQTWRFQRG